MDHEQGGPPWTRLTLASDLAEAHIPGRLRPWRLTGSGKKEVGTRGVITMGCTGWCGAGVRPAAEVDNGG
jgi:hypothetical protein